MGQCPRSSARLAEGLAVIRSKDHGLTRQHIAPVPAGIDPGHQKPSILPHGLP